MRTWSSCVLTLTALIWPGAQSAARSELTLAEVVENVRRNEQLYENVEVVMTTTYDIGDRSPASAKEVMRQQWRTRFVSQGEWFRLEREGGSQTSKRTASNDRIRAFDGQTTRALEQKAVGNISPERLEDENFIRPHLLLLRTSHIAVPLAVYLSGHEAVKAHPNGRWQDNLTMEVTYRGEDEFSGLKCQKVFVNVLLNGVAHDGQELWLAEDRNYLPVRDIFYTYRYSRDIPVGQAVADALQEISPGVWFPFDVQIVSYDMLMIQSEGRQKPRWREQYVVERADLHPKYERAFFATVDFPDGTAMYDVEKGEIKRSWRQGAPEAPGGPRAAGDPAERGAFWRRWLLWVNGIAFTGLAALLAVRKVRSRKAAARKS